MNRKHKCYALGLLVALATSLQVGCGSDSDDGAATTTATATTSTGTDLGSLGLAFPGDLVIGSALTADSSSTALADIDTYEKPQTFAQKEAVLDAILNATSIDQCFAVKIGSFPQPECFAPNVTKSEVEAAASGDNPFIFAYESSFTQLLYGDGGIVKTQESTGESCTAATVTYFTEDAIRFIEKGKQLFASILCASKFSDLALPEVGSTTDYLTALADVPLPTGSEFELASITREAGTDGDIYTTKLGVKFSINNTAQKLYAYFRHQPASTEGGTSKGHVIVMNSGIGDTLQSANQLALQDPPPPPDGNPQGPDNQAGGGAVAGVVSVTYESTGDKKNVILNRGNWKGVDTLDAASHPAAMISADGTFDYAGIAAINSGNNYADNFVNSRFDLGASETNLGRGVIGWTASLSDSFWRTFAYTVDLNTDSTETAKATFGFSPGYKQTEGTVDLPVAALGMFCAWAQNVGGAPNPPSLALQSDTYLETAGPAGQATNQVQYQVSTKAADGKLFVHDATESRLKFKIASDCGGETTDNNLVDIDSSGNITDKFTVPEITTFTPLGGVSLSATEFDLGTE
ncbi:MAG: hypothetical protein HRU19_12675 [Pseudobacteriovorax sp.]|nr:hypothetical protein [Pseudobacteriovorax sp.]